ncbi:nucleic acid-binding protein [Halobacteria archaeon AArc-curdl1]|uniref:Nucleic acid-binding protein n=1 Tax=Natronosalvus hydrolyticus TaxID=2979988 RepID=A0AAP2ZAX7_9EURY|nr:nucleic acid-binding protein [Halobacteria archaeon AArc-curdl1]
MTMEAFVYADGSVGFPGHHLGLDGEEPVDTINLSEYTATVVTWTTSTATPPGVRQPNHLAIVEFDLEDHEVDTPVRALGQLTTGDVESGDSVRPVYVDELRDPTVGIKAGSEQEWDGYRFEPISD